MHQANNLDKINGASGLLRHFDLDVAMILSLFWAQRGTTSLEIDLCDVLRSMGYTSLDNAPYQELRFSIGRLRQVDISIYPSGMNRALAPFWRVLSEAWIERPTGMGRPSQLKVQLSRVWEEALSNGSWQVIDLNGYVLMAQRDRENGLARVLYLYLSSWRTDGDKIRIPLRGLAERFAQRRTDGTYRYRDPIGDPRSIVSRGLRHLVQCGILKIHHDIAGVALDDAWMEGEIHHVPAPVAYKPRQLVFLERSVLGDPNVYRICASEQDSPPQSDEQRFSVLVQAYYTTTTPILIERLCGKPKLAIIDRALQDGWSVEQVWSLISMALYRFEILEKIRDPLAYVCGLIRNGNKDPSQREQWVAKESGVAMGVNFKDMKTWIFNTVLRDHPRPIRTTNHQEDK